MCYLTVNYITYFTCKSVQPVTVQYSSISVIQELFEIKRKAKMSHFDLQFEKMFVISTTALRINRAHYSIARNLKWIKQCFLFFLSTFTLFFFLLNAILFHDIRSGNVAEASKNLSMVLVAITITLKYVVLLYHQNSMKHIVATVNKDYDLAKDFPEEEKQIVLKYAKKGVTVSKFWLVFGFGTSAVFPAKAFALMAYYYWKGEFVLVPLFDFRYPDQIEVYKSETWMFLMQFGLCFVFGSYAATMYVGFDPLVPIFMLHTCGQLELLCGRISKAFVDDVNKTKKNLKVIVLKLQVLYE
ncbi:uncharacterized protein LOC113500609 [Trichoplusia ni]|uniref:Uncharacterized protein LOC113500609 n=1 Tax=Trichoplusia ni TaxID=7111 RepID=A0A7E5W990_TRINI|nr:uncharacterized protein LOC113500609 [Trichoplusia ni]